MSQLVAASEHWIPLIAALWLVSVLALIFSVRRYFASRALDREDATLTSPQEPFLKVDRTPQIANDRNFDAGVDSVARRIPEHHGITSLAHASHDDQAPPENRTEASERWTEPFNVAGEVATLPRKRAIGVEGIGAVGGLEAVEARISSDPASAQGLSELIRALYLDESNFTFQTIAGLSVEDRALAKGLINEWLADPSAVERWEQIYETVREKYQGNRWRESA